MIATAPGKLILTGEYAVLDGAPALVIAVDRRVVASTVTPPLGSSPFLIAVADELARRRGAADRAATAALGIAVDSSAFYEGDAKLGLGSSAAVTVAATALALASSVDGAIDREEVLAIALAAHAAAQGPRGARGSGADVAAAVHGGVIVYALQPEPARGSAPDLALLGADSTATRATPRPANPANDERPRRAETGCRVERRRWPVGVRLLPFFTGVSADTATLVARVTAARTTNRDGVEAALTAIASASSIICASLAANVTDDRHVIAGFKLAGIAIGQLEKATGVELVPACVGKAAVALASLGGTAKTTGAGGGDVGIAVIPATADATEATRLLIQSGCQPLRLSLDDTGVDTRPGPQ